MSMIWNMHSLAFMMVSSYRHTHTHTLYRSTFTIYQLITFDVNNYPILFYVYYTGHGGADAAQYAKEHLINLIVNQKAFWSNDDAEVLRAIKEGYIATHYAMWREQGRETDREQDISKNQQKNYHSATERYG